MNYKGTTVAAQETTGRIWRFSDYEFDELRRELRARGKAVELESKPKRKIVKLKMIMSGPITPAKYLFLKSIAMDQRWDLVIPR